MCKDLKVVKVTLPLSINKLLPFTNDLVIYLQYLIEMFVQLKLAAFKVLVRCVDASKIVIQGLASPLPQDP